MTSVMPELAETMHNAYHQAAHVPWKTPHGAPVPPWSACGGDVHAQWRAAAKAARDFLLAENDDEEPEDT